MTESPENSWIASRALGACALAFALLIPCPAAAIDIFSRESDADLLLREPRRIKALQLTVEMRFLTIDDVFLERVGADFSGSVSGRAIRRDQGVEGAKVILEAYAVENVGTPPRRSTARTGRQTVKTDAAGEFSLGLRNLVDPDTRAKILKGEVVSLVVEATGKNGKKVDFLRLRLSTVLGGLIP